MTAQELLFAHRYEEAAARYEVEIRQHPDDLSWLASRADAALCLGRLEDALANYRRANDFESRGPLAGVQPYLKYIGTVLWLLGRHAEAMATYKAAVDGVLDGSIKYADSAGGVSQGLLLWYAAVTAADAATTRHALKYLRNRAKRRAVTSWPGPLALFVLGQKAQEEALLATSGFADVESAINRAKGDLLRRRELVNALFYFAVRHRSEGREELCRAGMQQCASLENPIIEQEWYLARAEVANSPPRSR